MIKEYEDKNLCTQAEYARMKGVTRSRVCQMVKEGKLQTVWIRGNKLILLKNFEK